MQDRLIFMALFIIAASLTGCAGSTPNAEFKITLATENRICKIDGATIRLAVADDLKLEETVRARIEKKLQKAIEIKKIATQCTSDKIRNFVINSKVTRYDEGNAFARSMLAGLGQIHIDGDFSMANSSDDNNKLTEFTLSKTFAWGGAYGAAVGVADIEDTFAEAVAKTLVAEVPK